MLEVEDPLDGDDEQGEDGDNEGEEVTGDIEGDGDCDGDGDIVESEEVEEHETEEMMITINTEGEQPELIINDPSIQSQ